MDHGSLLFAQRKPTSCNGSNTGTRDAHRHESWLVGTLRNRCLKYWRARRRRLYTAVDSAILESVAGDGAPDQERTDLRRDLKGAMNRLRPRCRSILGLRYGLGCAPRETARRLGYKESSIYKLVERCLAALSSQLLDASPRHVR